MRGVLGTLGQLKRAQAQGHLPSGGDWAQYVDTLLGLTPASSSLQGRPIAPGTALNTGPTFSLTFKNLDQAEQHLRSLSGKPLTTADGLTANVSNQTAAKMASGSAVKKSADIRAHLAAIENFETLFQTGKVIESNPDRAEDLNITAIHRVHSRMEIENTAYNVKFTVKELLHPLTNRIYSIEAMELESAPLAGLLVHDTSRETERGTPLTGGAKDNTSPVAQRQETSSNNLPAQALWNGITGYDRRGNPKTVVILSRQDSGAYSIKINGTTHDFSETQTAAITGLTADQLRALRAGDASAQPVLVAKAAAPAPAAKQAPPPASRGAGTPLMTGGGGDKWVVISPQNTSSRAPSGTAQTRDLDSTPTNQKISNQEYASQPQDKISANDGIDKPKHLFGTTTDSVEYKLNNYSLNPDHPKGGPKSIWFKKALGFDLKNAHEFAAQIKFDEATAYQTKMTEFGQKYNQIISIQGANGKLIRVEFAWIRNPDGVIRLTTIVPGGVK